MKPEELKTAHEMGYPWDRLADAVEQLHNAERQAEGVLEQDDSEAKQIAAWDLREAIEGLARVRGSIADVFLLMVQCAIQERSKTLSSVLSNLLIRAGYPTLLERLDELEDAQVKLERQVGEVEDAILTMEGVR